MKKRIISPEELKLVQGCKVIGSYINRSGERCNIYETSDYSKFKRFPGNRNPELWNPKTGTLTGGGNKKSLRLLESMRADGVLDSGFTRVTPDGRILDVQHRSWAYIKLGLPIQFVIEYGTDPVKSMIIQNSNSTDWKTVNFIRSHAENGNEESANLVTLLDVYKLSVLGCAAITLGSGSTTLLGKRNFKSKTPWDQVFREANYIFELVSKGYDPKYLSNYRYCAMLLLIFRNAKNYNHALMRANAETMNTAINDKFTDSLCNSGLKYMVQSFQAIFNKSRTTNRLEFKTGYFDDMRGGLSN